MKWSIRNIACAAALRGFMPSKSLIEGATVSRGMCSFAKLPVETVSLSEAGLERIYQGSSIVWGWPLRLAPGETTEHALALAIRVFA